MCKFMFSVCNITFQIMSYMQVYVFCLQYHIPNNVVCASLCFLCLQYHIPNNVVCAISVVCFLFAISHGVISVCNIIPNNVQVYVFVCASLCFLFAISHSNYSRMCKFMFYVGNMTFSSMCKFLFCVCNITFQIQSYVQVYIFCLQYMCKFMFSVCNITFQLQACLQYHIPNIVICASLYFLFAISHSK